MSISAQQQVLDAELRDLWSRRSDLQNAELTRLCEIVLDVLQSCRPKELASLPEENKSYVVGFIINKVLPRDLLSHCDHTGALRVFYGNYLKDEIRRLKRLSEVPDRDFDDKGDVRYRMDDKDVRERLEHETDSLQALEESGFSCEQIADSARTWLAGAEEWTRVFLAYSNCPDAEQVEPLVKLARRLGIKSQAYKAEKLGFNWGKETHAGFEGTLIGRWIVSLGIDIRTENAVLVLGALKILCFEALSWADQQEVVR